MKIVITFLFVFISLFADNNSTNENETQIDDTKNLSLTEIKVKCISDELTVLNYQNQLIDFLKVISNVDTENKLLKAKLSENEQYYQKILDNQAKEFSVQLKYNQYNHDVVIDNLFYLFNIIVTIAVIIIVISGFTLTFFGRKLLKKAIGKEINKNFTEVLTTQQISQIKSNPEFNNLVKDIIDQNSATDDDVVDDPL